MAAIKIRSPKDFKCRNFRAHWLDQITFRKLVMPMALELDAWLKSGPLAPEGWRKEFKNLTGGWTFRVCGEGECPKTVYTIYVKGDCRKGAVDLDEWEARGRKPAGSDPMAELFDKEEEI